MKRLGIFRLVTKLALSFIICFSLTAPGLTFQDTPHKGMEGSPHHKALCVAVITRYPTY
jgi:hypothetical protein